MHTNASLDHRHHLDTHHTPYNTEKRLAAKELGGVFNFAHKAFVKMISSRRVGAPVAAAAAAVAAATGDDRGAEKANDEEAGNGHVKRSKKIQKGARANAGVVGEVAAGGGGWEGGQQDGEYSGGGGGGGKDGDDTRHLSVAFLCAFMEAGAWSVP